MKKRKSKKELNTHKKDAKKAIHALHKGGVIDIKAAIESAKQGLHAAMKKKLGSGSKVGA